MVHDALFVSGQLRVGETVLVTAAPSGVGVAALLLGKFLGAKVIGTSRSADKLDRLKAYGLDTGVVIGSEGFGEAISRAIGDQGVDMVVDNIGGDVLEPCLKALSVGGRFVTIGRMSGVTKGELDVDRLAERRLHRYGVSNRLRTPAQRAESAKRFLTDLLPALGDGRLRPVSTALFRSTRSPPPGPGSRPTGMSARSSSGRDRLAPRASRRASAKPVAGRAIWG